MNKAYVWSFKRFTLHKGIVVSSDTAVTKEIADLVTHMADNSISKVWHEYAFMEEVEYLDPHDVEHFGEWGARYQRDGWPDHSNIWSK